MRHPESGWRRTVGVVILLMACLLTAAWVRSRQRFDEIKISARQVDGEPYIDFISISLLSMKGRLVWKQFRQQIEPSDPASMEWMTESCLRKPFWTTSKYIPNVDRDHFNHDCDIMKWEWQWCGFGVCEAFDDALRIKRMASVPYWAIVLPMTLLSAWLLLSKPSPNLRSP